MSLLSSPKVEAFYFGELPRLLFWIGLVIIGFDLALFFTSWIIGSAPRPEMLLPQQSSFVFGVVAILLSSSIKNNGLLSLLLSLITPILVIFYYGQLKHGILGLTPELPLKMGILVIGTLMLFASLFFIALTYRFKRENKFPA